MAKQTQPITAADVRVRLLTEARRIRQPNERARKLHAHIHDAASDDERAALATEVIETLEANPGDPRLLADARSTLAGVEIRRIETAAPEERAEQLRRAIEAIEKVPELRGRMQRYQEMYVTMKATEEAE